MRLGLFGGTFDPVHYGHLLLAECCREQCRLDQVRFMPAAVPPHKKKRTLTDAKSRIEMLELAIGGHDALSVSDIEIQRGGVSYTVETLLSIKQQEPDKELFFLMGADMLSDLPHWKEPEQICQLATPVVVCRPGMSEPDFQCLRGLVSAERLEAIRQCQVEMPQIDIRSSDIRRRVAQGLSIRYQLPRAVEMSILTAKLYRD